MKLDAKSLNNTRDLLEFEDMLYEEQIEKKDAKSKRKKIQHKNTKKMMKR